MRIRLAAPAAIAFALTITPTMGRQLSVQEASFHGRQAFVLENEQMRVAVLPGGGFIGEVRFKSADALKSVNPMRVPHYQTIDPYSYDPARHADLYGTGNQARLMSGYMGHFLVFPQFAASSAAELRQGYEKHGEALAVHWARQQSPADPHVENLVMRADLPKTQFRVERTISLPAGETVAYVTETVENLLQVDRPYQWVQHITFGPPFVAQNRTFADASVQNVLDDSGGGVKLDAWPRKVDASDDVANYRGFTGRSSTWLMDRTQSKVFFTLYNEDYKVLIGYIFDSADTPWALDWQEIRSKTEKPWDGRVIARGICIGNSVADGLREAVEQGKLFGAPTFSWIGARERRTQRYAIFLAEIPTGFKGVAGLRAENGQISIEERVTGKKITLQSSQLW